MNQVLGESPQRRSLKSVLNSESLTWQLAALLLGVGLAIVALHAVFRLPLRLPGRHGLDWMALLMMTRLGSKYRWSATITSIGAAGFSFLPMWGFGDPFASVTYLLPGLIIDLVYHYAKGWQGKILFLALLGGLAHATKPLFQLAISMVSGYPFNSLLSGVAYPLLTHISFGFVGAFVGAGLIFAKEKMN